MDTSKFIKEVRKRPPLWDQKDINYHSRVIASRLWAELGRMFGLQGSGAKKNNGPDASGRVDVGIYHDRRKIPNSVNYSSRPLPWIQTRVPSLNNQYPTGVRKRALETCNLNRDVTQVNLQERDTIDCLNRAKIKWKSLRDMYRVELKKSLKYSPVGVRSNWAHFESMHFIKEQLHPRNRTDTGEVEVWYADSCDVPPHFDATSTPEEEEEDLKNPAELLAMGYPQHGGNFTHLQYAEEEGEDHFPGQRDVKRDLDEAMVSIEREKLELMRQERKERQDDDFLFLMSLLPTIRGLPQDKRMRLRGRIHDLVTLEVQQATSKKEYS
uniref:BESS domain-containing protein n=1 Tax=Timema bartmani TaxID=61472 RepID=A0A7R9I4I3_9NEOP|nr:unnamed protein product [Timema bartmani]